MKKFLLFMLFIFCYSLSYAGLSVDPSVTNVFGKPGQYYAGKYTVTNTNEYPIYVNIETSDGNSYSGNNGITCKDWLKFEKNKYYIRPGEKIFVPYEVHIKDGSKGSLCSKVHFSTEQEKAQMISISITVPIYITVDGTEIIDFNIDSIDLQTIKDNISYKLILENKGNVHIRHSGCIEIYSNNKKALLKTISIPETVPTYCESKREFTETMLSKTELKAGKYIAVFKIKALDKEICKEIKFKVSRLGEVVTE